MADKFDVNSTLEKGTDMLGTKGDQLTFAATLINHLTKLQIYLDLYTE